MSPNSRPISGLARTETPLPGSCIGDWGPAFSQGVRASTLRHERPSTISRTERLSAPSVRWREDAERLLASCYCLRLVASSPSTGFSATAEPEIAGGTGPASKTGCEGLGRSIHGAYCLPNKQSDFCDSDRRRLPQVCGSARRLLRGCTRCLVLVAPCPCSVSPCPCPVSFRATPAKCYPFASPLHHGAKI